VPVTVARRALAPGRRCRPTAPGGRTGAAFRTASGVVVSLSPAYAAGAREIDGRNVYLRTGLKMPPDGWVIDLGANRGLSRSGPRSTEHLLWL
jgi:hypothetical protein